MAESNRRNFFRQAAAEAVRGAREVIPLVDPLAALAENRPVSVTENPAPTTPYEEQTEPATSTSRTASVEEMLAIAAELGIGARAEDLRRLAVSSARLAPAADGDASSFAGGDPTVPGVVAVPEFEGGPARFVALLDVSGRGRLWVFRSGRDEDDSPSADPAETTTPEAAVVFEPASATAGPETILPPPGAMPFAISHELTLPRAWSSAVERLALSRAEQDSWQELRTRLAAAQGVALGESSRPHAAIHRVGGYPDERRGEMPLICELRLLGVDLEGRPPATHPLAGALAGETDDWKLLAQLASDDELGWSWGPRHQRLYVWARIAGPTGAGLADPQVVIQ